MKVILDFYSDGKDGPYRHYAGQAAADEAIRRAAKSIADSMIEDARGSGDSAVVFVTGNGYMPPLRSFSAAEQVWAATYPGDTGGEWEFLAEEVERLLSDANVALDCPEYDNALYVVDLNRFYYVADDNGDYTESLQDDWEPIGHFNRGPEPAGDR